MPLTFPQCLAALEPLLLLLLLPSFWNCLLFGGLGMTKQRKERDKKMRIENGIYSTLFGYQDTPFSCFEPKLESFLLESFLS